MNARTLLLDEQSEPSVRQLLGRLMAGAERADFAIARVRLAGLDLSPHELGGMRACRVLLGRFDAGTLADVQSPAGAAERGAAPRGLCAFLGSGRVQVRAAGVAAWTPDFSILHGSAGAVALIGGHYFARPEPAGGAVLTCATADAEAVRRAGERFEELWSLGYDVLDVVRDAVAAGLAGV